MAFAFVVASQWVEHSQLGLERVGFLRQLFKTETPPPSSDEKDESDCEESECSRIWGSNYEMMSFAEEKAYCRKLKVIACTEYLLL